MRAEARLDAARLAEIDRAILDNIAARKLPGAVFHLEREGAVYQKAYGRYTYEEGATVVRPDTVFDAASLSKVLSTAPSVLLLAEEGKLDLEAPLVRYLPECANGGKEAITVRQLLTHSSGLPAGLPARPAWAGKEASLALACTQAPTHAPGSLFRYSDINYVLLGHLVERVAGMPLERFAQQRIFRPLGMVDTGYLPLARTALARIAPTQRGPDALDASLHDDLAPGRLLAGVVHDPTVRRMGGVGGSAGVFSTARDVARFGRMLVGGGELDGVRVLSEQSVRLLTTVHGHRFALCAAPARHRVPRRIVWTYRLHRVHPVGRSAVADFLCAAVEPRLPGRQEQCAGAVHPARHAVGPGGGCRRAGHSVTLGIFREATVRLPRIRLSTLLGLNSISY
jgi:CubicO group peptidase (beta-lactamase class C family)